MQWFFWIIPKCPNCFVLGMDVFNFDPHNFIMDYHGIGFRECASEVARYLVGFEGLDLQDPLRLRLMSHLQCFSAQRDMALSSSQQSPAPSPWFSSLPAMPTPQYPSFASSRSSHSRDFPMYSSRSSAEGRPSSGSSAKSAETSGSSRGSPRMAHQIPVSPIALNASTLLGGFGRASVVLPEGPKQPSPVRPYRPWGTELAYWSLRKVSERTNKILPEPEH